MTPALDRELVELVLDSPEHSAKEHYDHFCTAHGLDMHYSTLLRALHRLKLSRKRLRGFARARDEAAARRFKAMIVSTYQPEQLFFLDETAKDPRALNRGWGWALRGKTPLDPTGFVGRGGRVSALCGFDVKGFVDWYIIDGTFNAAKFLDAFEQTVVRQSATRGSARWLTAHERLLPHALVRLSLSAASH